MSKKKKKKKHDKRKKKISLPRDRKGIPINLGDWVMFDEGPIHVISLTVYEDGGWSAGNEEDDYASDNLSGGEVVSLWK